MLKLADIVIRHRVLVIAIVALLTGLFGWQASRIGLNADFSTYLRQDDPLVQQYSAIGETFGGNSTGIALVSGATIFDPPTLQLIDDLTEAFRQVDGISNVTSLTNVIDFRKNEWGLEVGKLLKGGAIPDDPASLQELKRYVLGKSRYAGNLVSEDGTAAAILLKFAGGENQTQHFATSLLVKEAAEEVMAKTAPPENLSLYFGGMPFMIFNMTLLITNNLLVLLPLIILILVSVLYFSFRHWSGVLFPLAVVFITDIWVVGIMALIGLKFDLLSGIVPVILLALGSADGIHLLKRYFERRRLGNTAAEAARMVFKEMGTPILLTTITTMVGFAALAISDFSVIQQFGLLTALGVLLALVVTLTLLPALLSFGVSPRPVKKKKEISLPFIDRFGGYVFGHKAPVIIGALLIIAAAIPGVTRLFKDVDWTLCLQKGSPPYHAEIVLREKFGGSLPVQVLVQGDLKDPALLQATRRLERRLDLVPLVGYSQSVGSIISEMNGVMNDRQVVPDYRDQVGNLWFLIEDEEMMKHMVAENNSKALIQGKLSSWHTYFLKSAVDSIDAIINALPEKLAVIDLERVGPDARRALLQKWKNQTAMDLELILKKRGVSISRQQIDALFSSMEAFRADADYRGRLNSSVHDYLASPEAEIKLTARQVSQLAGRIAQAPFVSNSVDSSRLTTLLLRSLPNAPREDVEYLAESLISLIEEQHLEAQVAPALSGLCTLLPPRERDNQDLIRELKGELGRNSNRLISLDENIARAILGPDDSAIVRSVPWKVKQTGMAPLLNRMEEELTPTQTQSLVLTIIFVLILLTLIFRSPLGSLFGIVPMALTILINFAVMGYLAIGLDSFTAMIASIAIGLGIDTDIHFISRLRDELQQDGDERAAFVRTLKSTGLSIIINALAVGLGFLVLLAAGGQHIRRFGGLTALTILISAILTLSVLPALFFWAKPRFLRLAKARGLQNDKIAAIAK